MRLHWIHLGGMGAAAGAAALAGALLLTMPGNPGSFPALVLAGLLFAGLHVGLFAMPVFRLALFLGIRITLPRLLAAAGLIGAVPLSIVTAFPAWWAGLAGLCGGLAFWLVARDAMGRAE
jgi:hypothetical protein